MRIDRVHIVLLKFAGNHIACDNYVTWLCNSCKKMAYIKAIAALAIVLWLNYVRLCWKHRADRRRREITRRRRQEARIRRNFLHRRRMRRYYLAVACNRAHLSGKKYVLLQSPSQGTGVASTCSIRAVYMVQTTQRKLVGGSAEWKIW